jgi:hypothetical protein
MCAIVKESPLEPGLPIKCTQVTGSTSPIFYTTHTLMMRVFDIKKNGTDLEYQAYRNYALSTIVNPLHS